MGRIDVTSLGHLAKIFAGASEDEISKALAAQDNELLGEILVEHGVLTGAQLKRLLAKQRDMRENPTRTDTLKVVDYVIDTTDQQTAQMLDSLKELVKKS